MKLKNILYILIVLVTIASCSKESDVVYDATKGFSESTDPIDLYIDEHILKPFGVAIRWREVEPYIGSTQSATPPKREVVTTMVDLVRDVWIQPFLEMPDKGKFLKENFPIELIFVGSPIRNDNGSILLGQADSGAVITFTSINDVDFSSKPEVLRLIHTAEHEFSHVAHQKYNLPVGFKKVTPSNYKANNWLNMGNEVQRNSPRISNEAIGLGMVSNYATSAPEEDFAELISTYITSEQKEFEERYLEIEDCEAITDKDEKKGCEEKNEGRPFIKEKLELSKAFYQSNFNINLDDLRTEILSRIDTFTKGQKK